METADPPGPNGDDGAAPPPDRPDTPPREICDIASNQDTQQQQLQQHCSRAESDTTDVSATSPTDHLPAAHPASVPEPTQPPLPLALQDNEPHPAPAPAPAPQANIGDSPPENTFDEQEAGPPHSPHPAGQPDWLETNAEVAASPGRPGGKTVDPATQSDPPPPCGAPESGETASPGLGSAGSSRCPVSELPDLRGEPEPAGQAPGSPGDAGEGLHTEPPGDAAHSSACTADAGAQHCLPAEDAGDPALGRGAGPPAPGLHQDSAQACAEEALPDALNAPSARCAILPLESRPGSSHCTTPSLSNPEPVHALPVGGDAEVAPTPPLTESPMVSQLPGSHGGKLASEPMPPQGSQVASPPETNDCTAQRTLQSLPLTPYEDRDSGMLVDSDPVVKSDSGNLHLDSDPGDLPVSIEQDDDSRDAPASEPALNDLGDSPWETPVTEQQQQGEAEECSEEGNSRADETCQENCQPAPQFTDTGVAEQPSDVPDLLTMEMEEETPEPEDTAVAAPLPAMEDCQAEESQITEPALQNQLSPSAAQDGPDPSETDGASVTQQAEGPEEETSTLAHVSLVPINAAAPPGMTLSQANEGDTLEAGESSQLALPAFHEGPGLEESQQPLLSQAETEIGMEVEVDAPQCESEVSVAPLEPPPPPKNNISTEFSPSPLTDSTASLAAPLQEEKHVSGAPSTALPSSDCQAQWGQGQPLLKAGLVDCSAPLATTDALDHVPDRELMPTIASSLSQSPFPNHTVCAQPPLQLLSLPSSSSLSVAVRSVRTSVPDLSLSHLAQDTLPDQILEADPESDTDPEPLYETEAPAADPEPHSGSFPAALPPCVLPEPLLFTDSGAFNAGVPHTPVVPRAALIELPRDNTPLGEACAKPKTDRPIPQLLVVTRPALSPGAPRLPLVVSALPPSFPAVQTPARLTDTPTLPLPLAFSPVSNAAPPQPSVGPHNNIALSAASQQHNSPVPLSPLSDIPGARGGVLGKVREDLGTPAGKAQTTGPLLSPAQSKVCQWLADRISSSPGLPTPAPAPAPVFPGPSISGWTPPSDRHFTPLRGPHGKFISPPQRAPSSASPGSPADPAQRHTKGERSHTDIAELAKHEAEIEHRTAALKREGFWSLKRLSRVSEPARPKVHWDYLCEEMQWLSADFAQERRWKRGVARKVVRMVMRHHEELRQKEERARREEQAKLRRIASSIAKEVRCFWTSVEKVVQFKQQSRLEEKRKKALDLQLDFIVGQTEKYSDLLSQSLSEAPPPGPLPPARPTPATRPTQEEEDGDFEPQCEEEDDEETIEVEEQQEGNDAETQRREIELLRQEGELPLDELLQTLRAQMHKEDSSSVDEASRASSPALEEDEDEEFTADEDEGEDEEDTIAAQEVVEGGADHSQELNDLAKEGEMSMEELLDRYRGAYADDFEVPSSPASPPSSEEEGEEAASVSSRERDDEEEEEEEESEGEQSDEGSSSSDSSTVVESEDEDGGSGAGGDVGMEFLLKGDRSPPAPREKGPPGPRPKKEISDIAATAESLQPKGYTLATTQVKTPIPFLLYGTLREYQHIGLDWLVTMYEKKLNGILADEMGLGKTIQTISLLAHLACEKGNWGPHLIIVPTSVMLNWEMELKRWCPGFKILTYYGSQKERKLKRQGWTKPNAFHVCITSYKLVLQDHQAFRRKSWRYLILDEAQNIKNFKSQRWQSLLNFNSQRRLLLTGTPLQNSLMELWSLMHFLMPHVFQSHREFREWFSNPLTGMIEGSQEYNEGLVKRLHKVLRPFLLRRIKADVEKQMPKKYEHVVRCRLSKRQRFLYDDFMAQASTRETLASGHFMSVINILMQLRKVCNHPNLFDPRPIHSPFITSRVVYSTASLTLRALDTNPFKRCDLSMFDLVGLEGHVSRYQADVFLPRRKVTRRLIQEVMDSPDPPPRPKPVRMKVNRMFQPLPKADGRTVLLVNSPRPPPSPSCPVPRPPVAMEPVPVPPQPLSAPQAAPVLPRSPMATAGPSALCVATGAVRPAPPLPVLAVRSPGTLLRPPTATPSSAAPLTSYTASPTGTITQRVLLTPDMQARLPSGEVVSIAQLASLAGRPVQTSQGSKPVTFQLQGNKLTLSGAQVHQVNMGQPRPVQGNVVHLVSSGGQHHLISQPAQVAVIQTVSQSSAGVVTTHSAASTPTLALPLNTTQVPSSMVSGSGIVKIVVRQAAGKEGVPTLAVPPSPRTPLPSPQTNNSPSLRLPPPAQLTLRSPVPFPGPAHPPRPPLRSPSPPPSAPAPPPRPVLRVLQGPAAGTEQARLSTSSGREDSDVITLRMAAPTPAGPHLGSGLSLPRVRTQPPPPPRSPFYMSWLADRRKAQREARLSRILRVNEQHCSARPIYGQEVLQFLTITPRPAAPCGQWQSSGYAHCLAAQSDAPDRYWERSEALRRAIHTPEQRIQQLNTIIDRFIFVIPPVEAPAITMHTSHPPPWLAHDQAVFRERLRAELSPRTVCLHRIHCNMRTQFPDLRLIQYDCGKLQTLHRLLRRLKVGGHRVLIFTQMTRMLDVLEQFLNYHGHIYLRLDGSTRVEQRQSLMERFNADRRIFCFILSTRSGGVGVNLTGADTVVFYDSDWNPTMDAQAQDRCHRIGQTRDVHIYRLISERTVEENILKKANQKRMLGDMAIEGGNFTTAFFKQQTIRELFDLSEGERKEAELLSQPPPPPPPPRPEEEEPMNHKHTSILEQALCRAEDEEDIAAASQAKAEQVAELAEFNENIPLEEGSEGAGREQEEEELSKAEQEIAALVEQLTPIERYAMNFLEASLEEVCKEELKQAEEQVEAARKGLDQAKEEVFKLPSDDEANPSLPSTRASPEDPPNRRSRKTKERGAPSVRTSGRLRGPRTPAPEGGEANPAPEQLPEDSPPAQPGAEALGLGQIGTETPALPLPLSRPLDDGVQEAADIDVKEELVGKRLEAAEGNGEKSVSSSVSTSPPPPPHPPPPPLVLTPASIPNAPPTEDPCAGHPPPPPTTPPLSPLPHREVPETAAPAPQQDTKEEPPPPPAATRPPWCLLDSASPTKATPPPPPAQSVLPSPRRDVSPGTGTAGPPERDQLPSLAHPPSPPPALQPITSEAPPQTNPPAAAILSSVPSTAPAPPNSLPLSPVPPVKPFSPVALPIPDRAAPGGPSDALGAQCTPETHTSPGEPVVEVGEGQLAIALETHAETNRVPPSTPPSTPPTQEVHDGGPPSAISPDTAPPKALVDPKPQPPEGDVTAGRGEPLRRPDLEPPAPGPSPQPLLPPPTSPTVPPLSSPALPSPVSESLSPASSSPSSPPPLAPARSPRKRVSADGEILSRLPEDSPSAKVLRKLPGRLVTVVEEKELKRRRRGLSGGKKEEGQPAGGGGAAGTEEGAEARMRESSSPTGQPAQQEQPNQTPPGVATRNPQDPLPSPGRIPPHPLDMPVLRNLPVRRRLETESRMAAQLGEQGRGRGRGGGGGERRPNAGERSPSKQDTPPDPDSLSPDGTGTSNTNTTPPGKRKRGRPPKTPPRVMEESKSVNSPPKTQVVVGGAAGERSPSPSPKRKRGRPRKDQQRRPDSDMVSPASTPQSSSAANAVLTSTPSSSSPPNPPSLAVTSDGPQTCPPLPPPLPAGAHMLPTDSAREWAEGGGEKAAGEMIGAEEGQTIAGAEMEAEKGRLAGERGEKEECGEIGKSGHSVEKETEERRAGKRSDGEEEEEEEEPPPSHRKRRRVTRSSGEQRSPSPSRSASPSLRRVTRATIRGGTPLPHTKERRRRSQTGEERRGKRQKHKHSSQSQESVRSSSPSSSFSPSSSSSSSRSSSRSGKKKKKKKKQQQKKRSVGSPGGKRKREEEEGESEEEGETTSRRRVAHPSSQSSSGSSSDSEESPGEGGQRLTRAAHRKLEVGREGEPGEEKRRGLKRRGRGRASSGRLTPNTVTTTTGGESGSEVSVRVTRRTSAHKDRTPGRTAAQPTSDSEPKKKKTSLASPKQQQRRRKQQQQQRPSPATEVLGKRCSALNAAAKLLAMRGRGSVRPASVGGSSGGGPGRPGARGQEGGNTSTSSSSSADRGSHSDPGGGGGSAEEEQRQGRHESEGEDPGPRSTRQRPGPLVPPLESESKKAAADDAKEKKKKKKEGKKSRAGAKRSAQSRSPSESESGRSSRSSSSSRSSGSRGSRSLSSQSTGCSRADSRASSSTGADSTRREGKGSQGASSCSEGLGGDREQRRQWRHSRKGGRPRRRRDSSSEHERGGREKERGGRRASRGGGHSRQRGPPSEGTPDRVLRSVAAAAAAQARTPASNTRSSSSSSAHRHPPPSRRGKT
ncbi:helicase SRCAP isoform X2 [Amia ocellicauda]|uniref:helicase SRCAP isoform X2 n=1 Tax=Amia ocellicauda TaxID=2972642 RepID=UPI0034642007